MPAPDETQQGPDGQLRKWQPDTRNLEAFNYLGPSSGFSSAEEAAAADLASGQGSWVPASTGGGMPWWMKAFVGVGLGSAAVTGLGAALAPGLFGGAGAGAAGAAGGAAGAGATGSAAVPAGLAMSSQTPAAIAAGAGAPSFGLGAAPALGAGVGAGLPASLAMSSQTPAQIAAMSGAPSLALGAAPRAGGGVTPTLPTTPTTPPKSATSSLSNDFIKNVPQLAGILTAIIGSRSGTTGSNPASDALNGLVPQLTSQLTQLSQNDLQRRQMSDPLYEAVLRGAMGGLPVWMRGGSSINPPNPMATPSLTPPTTPKV
jgi:hypothetical protein